jgi:hypothetical protein
MCALVQSVDHHQKVAEVMQHLTTDCPAQLTRRDHPLNRHNLLKHNTGEVCEKCGELVGSSACQR